MPEKLKELEAKWDAWNKENVPPRWTTGLGGAGAKAKKAKKK